MAFDIGVKTKTLLGNEDRRWLGTRMGTDQNRSITLDVSGFLSTHLIEGALPSGMLLAQLTATGLYVPYAGGAAEVQTLTRTSTGGTITLSFDGEVTGTIPASAAGFTAAAVKAALEAISTINPGDVAVTGADGGPITVTFSGARVLDQNVPQLVVDNGSATGGTIVAATVTSGAPPASDGSEVAAGFLFSTTKIGDGTGADLATAPNVGAALYWGPGIIKASKLPAHAAATGKLDAAARAELRFIRFEA